MKIECGWLGKSHPAQICLVIRETTTKTPREYHPLCLRCAKWARPIIAITTQHVDPADLDSEIVPSFVTDEPLSREIVTEARKGRLVSLHGKE